MASASTFSKSFVKTRGPIRAENAAARHARSERHFILMRYDYDTERLPAGIAKCVRELEVTIARNTLAEGGMS